MKVADLNFVVKVDFSEGFVVNSLKVVEGVGFLWEKLFYHKISILKKDDLTDLI